MFGTLSKERVVNVPASEAWKLYGTVEFANLVRESVTSFVTKINVVEGGGWVGTVLEVVMRTGAKEDATISYLEMYIVIDNEKRCKVKEMIEGNFLDMGFASYRVRLEVIEKEGHEGEEQCIIKTTLEYMRSEKRLMPIMLVSIDPYVALMDAAKDRLEKCHNKGK